MDCRCLQPFAAGTRHEKLCRLAGPKVRWKASDGNNSCGKNRDSYNRNARTRNKKTTESRGGAEEKIPIATANEPGRSRPSIDASGKDLKTFLRIIKEKCTKLFAITEKSYIFDPEISTKNKAEQVKKE